MEATPRERKQLNAAAAQYQSAFERTVAETGDRLMAGGMPLFEFFARLTKEVWAEHGTPIDGYELAESDMVYLLAHLGTLAVMARIGNNLIEEVGTSYGN